MAAENILNIPRPEHPRPDFVRETFCNLNGVWQFAFDDADEGLAGGCAERGRHQSVWRVLWRLSAGHRGARGVSPQAQCAAEYKKLGVIWLLPSGFIEQLQNA